MSFWECSVKRAAELFLAMLILLAPPALAAELPACENVAALNDAHIQSLSLGMSKDEVLFAMGTGECSGLGKPEKVSSFKVGSDLVEVLWYKSASASGLKPIYIKNGKYGGQKIGFITLPSTGS